MNDPSEKLSKVSPLDDPQIGFVESAERPMWWNYAIAVVIVLFLVVLMLYIVRIAVRSIPSPSAELAQPTLTKTAPTTTAPNQNFEIMITPDGISAADTKRILNVDDVVLISNKDTVAHNIVIQDVTYTVSPNEIYAHKTSTRGTLKLVIVGAQGTNTTLTFTVR